MRSTVIVNAVWTPLGWEHAPAKTCPDGAAPSASERFIVRGVAVRPDLPSGRPEEDSWLATDRMRGRATVRRSLTVPGRPEQAAAARRFVGDALGEGHQQAEAAVLLVSELLTNSLRHSASARDGGTITITVTVTLHDLVRVQVTDDGAATLPRARPACGPDEEAGRGLQLVNALASAWSCRRHGSRTTTWFELAASTQQAHLTPFRASTCGTRARLLGV